jgi:hypothetical protein
MSSLTYLLGQRNIPVSPCCRPWIGPSRWEGRSEDWRSSFPRRGISRQVDIRVETDFQKTHVSVNPWVIHRSKEFFGQDAKEFNPNRWLEPRSKDMERYMMQVCGSFRTALQGLTVIVRCGIQLLSWTESGPNGNLQGYCNAAPRLRHPASWPITQLDFQVPLHSSSIRLAMLRKTTRSVFR